MKEQIKESLKAVAVLLLIFIPLIYLSTNYKIAITVGTSMDPTIKDGEKLFISLNQEPQIGDIVSVHIDQHYGTDAEFIVKRLVDIKDGQMYLQKYHMTAAIMDMYH